MVSTSCLVGVYRLSERDIQAAASPTYGQARKLCVCLRNQRANVLSTYPIHNFDDFGLVTGGHAG